MIDFDKMTKEEHEEYREMQRKAECYNEIKKYIESKLEVEDDYYDVKNNDFDAGLIIAYEGVESIIENHESGDHS